MYAFQIFLRVGVTNDLHPVAPVASPAIANTYVSGGIIIGSDFLNPFYCEDF